LSKSAKTNLIYLGLGLIPILLLLLPQADPKGTFVHAFTKVFPYPLYMGFALVGFLCFKINQIRILFSVLLLLGICSLLFNPLALDFMGIKTWGIYNVVAIKGFLFPQLALVSLAIFAVVAHLQKDRIVTPFVRVFGITLIPLIIAIWTGLALYSDIWKRVPKRIAKDADVLTAFPSLPIVAALTIICAILLHAIFRTYWHRVYVDELTDIANRRALDERLSHLSGEYAIAMMDIDHFKAFNDNYGHDEGDNVLKLVGGLLSEELGNKVYRYGGEEFCAVFMGVSAEDAYMFVNKVRRKLEERNFYIRKPNSKRVRTSSSDRKKKKKNGKKVQITISIGLANPNKKAKTVEAVFKLADQALYEAKRKGRNRVIVWEIEGIKSAV